MIWLVMYLHQQKDESVYTAKGMIQQVQESIVSTREAQVQREDLQEEQTVVRQDVRVNRTTIVEDRGGQSNSRQHAHTHPDPLSQTFMVDIKDGIFLTSVDVFFSSKSSATPVQIQIRTVTMVILQIQ